MATRTFGQRIKRNEDPRLLRGEALFVDDVNLPHMAHVAFVRSPYAHARINSIDIGAAEALEGVVKVYTAEGLGDYWRRGLPNVSPPPIKDLEFHSRLHPILAKEKVCHVGEVVVCIVAENRYIAEDAANLVIVDYEPLPVHIDARKALEADAALIHEDLDSNLAAHVVQKRGDYAKAAIEADLVIKREFVYDRGTAAAMENRGVVADWDAKADKLTIWDTTQAPVIIRNGLAGMLGLSEHQVRLIAPFIGGGFGPKILMWYPEEMLIPWISMQLKRPVKWIEDRSENFYATTQERGQTHESEIALKKDGTVLGVKDVFWHDNGAYDPYGLTVPINTQCTLLGMYEVPNYYSEFTAVFTNKPIVSPYRGAGRQHGVFVMERLLDAAAKALNMDKAEIRRKNFIPPEAFPYNHKIIFQDFTELTYDSGNYEPVLDQALEMIDYANFYKSAKPKAQKAGKKLGLGLVCYVEGTGIGPYEGARIQVQANGRVSVASGIGTQGQGHFTSFAQIVADQLGVKVTDVDLVTGDTDQFHWGVGTFASRGATVAGNAIHAAAVAVRRKVLAKAVEEFEGEVTEDQLELVDGKVQILGAPETAIPLGDLAVRANPLRGAVKPGTEPGLEATDYFGPEMGATASGAHAMIVEVDEETMQVEIKKYVVVHDCGEIINPLILDGQIHGGVAQGLGNAFFEELVFDEMGQITNASFMDYLLPTALDVPRMITGHQVTPSPLNPLGIKGAGEAGAIPVGPLFAQAVEDALDLEGFEIREIPLSPLKLWDLVKAHKSSGKQSSS
ncbi:MAG: xanthine dehydrogenase family protein molybdopterin-binding subunit [Chloroflexi bacterium]|nr:xanthine dehydrogenase family protein molybdopterin-binding subunit [Chloroflexota bacterium]MQC26718.1 xanthine dehydrogenase family protein molybdopterin-binding subunit [Chloroflexota bacterium]